VVTSAFDLFKLGVGPSSSHTMGPMTAAARFVALLSTEGLLASTARLTVKLYATLALTGKGHATDRGVILGLMGYLPDSLDPDVGEAAIARLETDHLIVLGGERIMEFDPRHDIVWAGQERLPAHPNALSLTAVDSSGEVLIARTYFSIGGGFVRDEIEMTANQPDGIPERAVPFPFESATELLHMAETSGLTIAALMLANEVARRPDTEVFEKLDAIVTAMEACIERGLTQGGQLPGGLKVKRRAADAYKAVAARLEQQIADPLVAMDFINLWALAVNEENAAGGKVVTAPTNGAAGIIPAVLRFYDRFHHGTMGGRRDFLLTAAAIGALYKRNASISGAEVGCQGEVGVACSMAAAGLCAALGGTNAQTENAAEIAMEHNLGLTCDPIGGLVQIPCIERNAMGAVKAIDATRLALLGDGNHSVSLDKVIATMKRTGADMSHIYKETSLGGLALDLGVNRVEC
jgi:L-serine dehydratase